MLKTYLYLPEELNQRIYLIARAQKKSKAEVIRLSIEKGINTVGQLGNASAAILLKLANLGRQFSLRGPKDSSVKMDELLWGKDWSHDE